MDGIVGAWGLGRLGLAATRKNCRGAVTFRRPRVTFWRPRLSLEFLCVVVLRLMAVKAKARGRVSGRCTTLAHTSLAAHIFIVRVCRTRPV
jgi:hypothetical protein